MIPATSTTISGSSGSSSAAEAWDTINKGLDGLIALKDPSHISYSEHGILYTSVYNYTTASGSHWNNVDMPGMVDLKLEDSQRSPNAVLYCALSNKLNNHLRSMLHDASGLLGESLLEFYYLQWSRYRVLVPMLDRVCVQVTQTWVKRTMAERRDIYTVEALAFSCWKRILVDGLQGGDRRLTRAFMRPVSSRRANKPVSLEVLRTVLGSLATLGRSGEHGEISTLDVYHEVFEKPFFDETLDHYQKAAGGLIRGSTQNYFREAGNWLAVENGFSDVFPTDESYARLHTILKEVLLVHHTQRIETYMSNSIRESAHENLKILYSFCARLSGGIGHLRELFVRLFQRAVAGAPTAHDERASKLASLERVYLAIVMEDFEKDPVILEGLKRVAKTIFNSS